jgi:predicted TIM-barrel fold metal-dependent hydrolase
MGVVGSADMLEPLAHRIAPFGWHLQLLLQPDALVDLAPVVERLPVALVFDHFGRISPPDAGVHPAHALILDLLRDDRAWVKLSGGYIVSSMRTVLDPALDALANSYLRAAPRRIVWGSDWPHATASAGVQPMPDDARQLERLSEWIDQSGDAATLRRVLVDNPAELYDFKPAAPSAHGSGDA